MTTFVFPVFHKDSISEYISKVKPKVHKSEMYEGIYWRQGYAADHWQKNPGCECGQGCDEVAQGLVAVWVVCLAGSFGGLPC